MSIQNTNDIKNLRDNAEITSKLKTVEEVEEFCYILMNNISKVTIDQDNYMMLEKICNNLLIQYLNLMDGDTISPVINQLIQRMNQENLLNPIYEKRFRELLQKGQNRQLKIPYCHDSNELKPNNLSLKKIEEMFGSNNQIFNEFKKYGIGLCTMDGKFVFGTLSFKRMLEMDEETFMEKSLFDLMVKFSQEKFQKKFKDLNFLNCFKENEQTVGFSFVKYSQQKSDQFVNFLKKKGIKKLKFQQENQDEKLSHAYFQRHFKAFTVNLTHSYLQVNSKDIIGSLDKYHKQPFMINQEFLKKNKISKYSIDKVKRTHIVPIVKIKIRECNSIPKFNFCELLRDEQFCQLQNKIVEQIKQLHGNQ